MQTSTGKEAETTACMIACSREEAVETPIAYDIAAPEPAGMVASLSSLGYSLPATVANLVDNSISVETKTIDVAFT
ncbi:hypothetical protein ACFWPP_12165 [Streptomyces anulatus]|uniref:hypothetical protein n=1 Tax=Streptomyces anulatus TaxID=1892 RepID=UPI00364AAC48